MDKRREHLLTFCSLHPSLRDDNALGVLAAPLEVPAGEGVYRRWRSHLNNAASASSPSCSTSWTASRPPAHVCSWSRIVHWSDPSTLRAAAPPTLRGPPPDAGVLVTMRPSANELPLRRGMTVFDLASLEDEDVRQLAEQASPGLPDDLKEMVVQRADGVPLFVVELARMLARPG